MSSTAKITKEFVDLARHIYGDDFIPLHRPVFEGNEKQYLVDCIDSNFVSSVGERVTEFENAVAHFMGADFGVATVNGTAALHMSLLTVGVKPGDEVISQALTFVATANAISYMGASCVFLDVDRDTMGMSPAALRNWLETNATISGGKAINKSTGARIAACVPMHTFGNPLRVQQIADICAEFKIPLVEDAAESLGSYVGSTHTGTFGEVSAVSFNGNKILTTGGGGVIVTNNEAIAKHAKHLTTTAKRPHPFEYFHDEVGYNYRLPNLNAALGVAQMELLPQMLANKADVAKQYRIFAAEHGLEFVDPIEGGTSNHWLNALVLSDRDVRDEFLKATNDAGVMTRPIWNLMNELPMFEHSQCDDLSKSKWLADRVVNIPSSVPDNSLAGAR